MSFSTTDTIVALATPRGRGALGVIRLSGSESRAIFSLLSGGRRLEDRRATLCRLSDLDEVVATLFAGPASFTGEDVVEVTAHGGPAILDSIIERCLMAGARLARPGEFSLRAVASGRIDLAQAEAVASLVEASTGLQATMAYRQLRGGVGRVIAEFEREIFELEALLEASIDFPDEGYVFIGSEQVRERLVRLALRIEAVIESGRRGATIREGARVVLTGLRNAGKSSLFNRLVGEDRAIVSDCPGTTRDVVSEVVSITGVPVTLLDTAGLGRSGDPVESAGMGRAMSAVESAELVLVVVDGRRSVGLEEAVAELGLRGNARQVLVRTRLDLRFDGEPGGDRSRGLWTSAVTGEGIRELQEAIGRALVGDEGAGELPAVSSRRQLALLERVLGLVRQAADAAGSGAPEEFVAQSLVEARVQLEDVVGRRPDDAVLHEVFSRFCIGK